MSDFSVPIKGDIVTTEVRGPQKSAQEFQKILDGVFKGGLVKAVRWEQYTPYFNDGDPCIFGSSLWEEEFALIGDDEEWTDGRNLFQISEKPGYIVGSDGKVHRGWAITEPFSYSDERYRVLDALNRFSTAILGGEFYDVLERNFGDHARVIAYPDRFEVEFYSHD